MNMEKLIEGLLNLATDLALKIVTCLVVFVIGNYLIKRVVRMLDKSRLMKETEGTVRTFTASFIKIAMYVILAIIIVNIMGVPMASVITVLASAGVAVGMAMQGALGNIASGIVLMLFKPFKLGDYVSIGSVEGTVRELNLFYTVFVTVDNRRVTVPNSTMMNANIIDVSAEENRRVDLYFTCDRLEDQVLVTQLLTEEVEKTEKMLKEPAPFVSLDGITDTTLKFVVKVWCRNVDYWDVYYDLLTRITAQLEANEISIPSMRVSSLDQPRIRQ